VYTKTSLGREAVDELTRSGAVSTYLKVLRENALLIFGPGDWAVLRDSLPLQYRGRLKDDIEKRRQPWRLAPAPPEIDLTLEPEIILGVDNAAPHAKPPKYPLPEFVDAPMVDLRSRIRSGAHTVADRDDFWEMCLLPVIDSLPPESRTFTMFDCYALQDSSRLLSRRTLGGRPPTPTDSGLGWFLSRIDGACRRNDRKASAVIHTLIDPGKTPFSINQISDALEQVTSDLSLDGLEVSVLAYKLGNESVERRLTNLLHHRSLIMNDKCRFLFNYGFSDADRFSSKNGQPRNDLPTVWSWFPELSPEFIEERSIIEEQSGKATRLLIS